MSKSLLLPPLFQKKRLSHIPFVSSCLFFSTTGCIHTQWHLSPTCCVAHIVALQWPPVVSTMEGSTNGNFVRCKLKVCLSSNWTGPPSAAKPLDVTHMAWRVLGCEKRGGILIGPHEHKSFPPLSHTFARHCSCALRNILRLFQTLKIFLLRSFYSINRYWINW